MERFGCDDVVHARLQLVPVGELHQSGKIISDRHRQNAVGDESLSFHIDKHSLWHVFGDSECWSWQTLGRRYKDVTNGVAGDKFTSAPALIEKVGPDRSWRK